MEAKSLAVDPFADRCKYICNICEVIQAIICNFKAPFAFLARVNPTFN